MPPSRRGRVRVFGCFPTRRLLLDAGASFLRERLEEFLHGRFALLVSGALVFCCLASLRVRVPRARRANCLRMKLGTARMGHYTT